MDGFPQKENTWQNNKYPGVGRQHHPPEERVSYMLQQLGPWKVPCNRLRGAEQGSQITVRPRGSSFSPRGAGDLTSWALLVSAGHGRRFPAFTLLSLLLQKGYVDLNFARCFPLCSGTSCCFNFLDFLYSERIFLPLKITDDPRIYLNKSERRFSSTREFCWHLAPSWLILKSEERDHM